MSDNAGKEETNYYAYGPSLGAAVIFVLLFVASSGYHAWQIYRLRSWYFIPFLIGCLRKIMFPALSSHSEFPKLWLIIALQLRWADMLVEL